jgi:hypothetical protein
MARIGTGTRLGGRHPSNGHDASWDEIGKLGAIVVLRTVLNYFLEREIEQEQKKAKYVLESAA